MYTSPWRNGPTQPSGSSLEHIVKDLTWRKFHLGHYIFNQLLPNAVKIEKQKEISEVKSEKLRVYFIVFFVNLVENSVDLTL